MIGRVLNAPITWFVVLVVVAVVFVNQHAANEAQTNYDNQIASCEAGNPVREAVVLAVATAARNANSGNASYEEAREKIINAPHVLKSGARDCLKAVEHP